MPLTELTVDAFIILRNAFFEPDGTPRPFSLRDKRNTQDDPLDEYIADLLSRELHDAQCQRASGPLISPDMAIFRLDECNAVSRDILKEDLTRVVAIEVKKLERAASGQISRAAGLDYNTTPPCGIVRVYDARDQAVDIRGFYLFVCQEARPNNTLILSALALCDGNLLNQDFGLYLQVTGRRTKGVQLGTYGDGVNRNRPMLIFANPLGAAQLDRAATLVSGSPTAQVDPRIERMYEIGRTIPEGGRGLFSAYRLLSDVPASWEPLQLVDPFPRPVSTADTAARGRFKLPIRPAGEGAPA